MLDKAALLEFITPYYADKDVMHDLWHIELVLKTVEKLLSQGGYAVDAEALVLAAYFHGFIYQDEEAIVRWMKNAGYADAVIEKATRIAWESQRSEVPETLEGKLLHDAHVLEGGKAYLVVKTLITGSVRGQSLTETLDFMQRNVLDKSRCYLPETIPLCDEMNDYANAFYRDLMEGIWREKPGVE